MCCDDIPDAGACVISYSGSVSAGLLGLLDDVAAIAKAAAASLDDVGAAAGKATAKAAGVVIDDTAVTPQFVTGVSPDRELPIIKKIAWGSIRNKLLIILPVALLLSWVAPWALAPILMCGGLYLAYEGAEKVWRRIHSRRRPSQPTAPVAPAEGATVDEVPADDEIAPAGEVSAVAGVFANDDAPAAVRDADAERRLVSSAIRTDLILSAEIMVISLGEVAHESFWRRLVILVVVAIVLTIGVYGVVGLIVKMDDIGLALTRREGRVVRRIGRSLAIGMPRVLAVIGAVGTVAMLWVGGHILLKGAADLGRPDPFDAVHQLSHAIGGGVQGWLVETAISTVAGMAVGAVILGVIHLLPRRHDATDGD
jgi:predicted DNA repair protein MutK